MDTREKVLSISDLLKTREEILSGTVDLMTDGDYEKEKKRNYRRGVEVLFGALLSVIATKSFEEGENCKEPPSSPKRM